MYTDASESISTSTHIARREEVLASTLAHDEALAVVVAAREVHPAEDVPEGRRAVLVLREAGVHVALNAVLIMVCPCTYHVQVGHTSSDGFRDKRPAAEVLLTGLL